MTFSDLKDGDTVRVERRTEVIKGVVRTINGVITIVGKRNALGFTTHLPIHNAEQYGWKLCKI